MTDRDPTYLDHIIERIETYTQEGRGVFLTDPQVQDAVIRNFEGIGEAVKRLSNDATGREPGVPWPEIARFRDVLIHNYIGVDLGLVWDTVERDVPVLKAAAERLRRTAPSPRRAGGGRPPAGGRA